MFLPEGFYSDGYQLIDRCNTRIECNLKDTGTIVDTKFAHEATSRKISVHVGVDNVVTLSSVLASIMGFSPREMTFSEERKARERSLWTRTEDSIVYTSIAMRLCEANRALYEYYYTQQSGGDLPVFYGARTQRGHGLGSVLEGLFRRELSFLKSEAESLSKQALNVATDMIDGKSFKESTKDRLKEGIKTFASQREAIQQSGCGVRRKRRRQSKKSSKKSKKRKIYIFD